MKNYGIGEIARKAGVASSTIRYYERIGLLPPVKRISGKRRYELAVLQKISLIRLAQAAGFTIAEIQSLLHDFPAETAPAIRWQALASKKILELDKLTQQIQAQRAILEKTLKCQCPQIEDCASDKISC